MPQSRHNPSSRMTANPLRPTQRYRPGKALAEEPSSEEEDESEEEPVSDPQPTRPKATSFPASATTARSRAPPPSKEVEPDSDDEEGFITDEEEDGDEKATLPNIGSVTTSTAKKPTPPVSRSSKQEPIKSESEDAAESSEEEEEDESLEEDSSSSEEEIRRKLQRPTFIKKTDRKPGISPATAAQSHDPEEASTIAVAAEEARRKQMADLMIKDKLERDAAARAAGKKYWDDDDEVAPEDTVDDTDGLDPEAEYAAWKLRELKRLKRDREVIEAREKEIEEIERRKNLTKEEREAEDREFLARQADERDASRGKAGFLAKYHHKGAFFQDEEILKEISKRDLMSAKYEDQVGDKSVLPKYMQVRDQNMVGKKGRTRYTDLRTEDTGRWGAYNDDRGRRKREGEFKPADDVVDERFRPDAPADRGPRVSGANASTVGDRRKRSRSPVRDRDKRQRVAS